MSYIKQNWQTGDVITADKLNHMEDGIASLDGYDIVFTKTIDSTHGLPVIVLTADGASFEELLNGGEKKAKSFTMSLMADDTAESYDKSVEFNKLSVNSVTAVQFAFVGDTEPLGIHLIKLDSTGAYSDIIKNINGDRETLSSGTYTYSDGHYVFTSSGEPE